MKPTRVITYNHCLFPAQPPDKEFAISRWDATRLLMKKKALLICWYSEFDRPKESAFWHVIKDSFVPPESLGKNRRAEIRKGLRNYDVRPICQSYVVDHGYPVYCAAHTRYNAPTVISEETFRADMSNKDEDCYDYWGVFVKGTETLVGYCANRVFSDTCNYVVEKIPPEHLRKYASYAVNYIMNEHYLQNLGFRYVNIGAKNMRHDTNVQEFHISKMGFRRAYCRLNVRFLPGIRLLLCVLQPFRHCFSGKRGWKENIDLLFTLMEYSDFAHQAEIVYFREGSLDTEEYTDVESQTRPYRITKFRPTIGCLAKHPLTARDRLLHLFWYLTCRDKYTIYYVLDGNRIIHRSYVLSANFRFTYMNKNESSIGPIWTDPMYRGQGIASAVLRYICATHEDGGLLYMTTNCENVASRRTIERAGFRFCSYGYTTRFLRLFRKMR